MRPASDGVRPPPSGVLGQEIEEARFADEFLNARGGADDPQHTMRGRGQVVDLNQLADAAGVQIRHGRQIQLYSSNPSAHDGVHRQLQITADRDEEGSTDVQNRDARGTFHSNASHVGTSLKELDARTSKPDSKVNTLHSAGIPQRSVTC